MSIGPSVPRVPRTSSRTGCSARAPTLWPSGTRWHRTTAANTNANTDTDTDTDIRLTPPTPTPTPPSTGWLGTTRLKVFLAQSGQQRLGSYTWSAAELINSHRLPVSLSPCRLPTTLRALCLLPLKCELTSLSNQPTTILSGGSSVGIDTSIASRLLLEAALV